MTQFPKSSLSWGGGGPECGCPWCWLLLLSSGAASWVGPRALKTWPGRRVSRQECAIQESHTQVSFFSPHCRHPSIWLSSPLSPWHGASCGHPPSGIFAFHPLVQSQAPSISLLCLSWQLDQSAINSTKVAELVSVFIQHIGPLAHYL